MGHYICSDFVVVDVKVAVLGDATHGTDTISLVVSLVRHLRGECQSPERAGALLEDRGWLHIVL